MSGRHRRAEMRIERRLVAVRRQLKRTIYLSRFHSLSAAQFSVAHRAGVPG